MKEAALGQETTRSARSNVITCYNCGRRGHIARFCRAGERSRREPITQASVSVAAVPSSRGVGIVFGLLA